MFPASRSQHTKWGEKNKKTQVIPRMGLTTKFEGGVANRKENTNPGWGDPNLQAAVRLPRLAMSRVVLYGLQTRFLKRNSPQIIHPLALRSSPPTRHQ